MQCKAREEEKASVSIIARITPRANLGAAVIRIIIMMPMIIMITKIIMTMMIYTVFPFSKVAILSHLKTSRVMKVNKGNPFMQFSLFKQALPK